MNRSAAIAASVIAVAVAACAAPPFADRPPARFQGDASFTLNLVAPERVDDACQQLGAPRAARACQRGGLVIFPNPCAWANPSDLRDLLCHELGHVNAWPGDHPKD